MKTNRSLVVKLLISVFLFLCLLDMPYGFYQLVRFIAFAGFGYLAYQSYAENKKQISVLFLILAIFFQPFVKISLGREIWNIVDVVVGIGLIISVIFKPKK